MGLNICACTILFVSCHFIFLQFIDCLMTAKLAIVLYKPHTHAHARQFRFIIVNSSAICFLFTLFCPETHRNVWYLWKWITFFATFILSHRACVVFGKLSVFIFVGWLVSWLVGRSVGWLFVNSGLPFVCAASLLLLLVAALSSTWIN